MNEQTFTNLAGVTYRLRPVSRSLMAPALAKIEHEFRERGEPLDPPTYTISTLGGGQEIHPHNKKTLDDDDPEQTKANREAWDKYQAACQRLARAQTQKAVYLYLMDGLDFEVPEDGWDKRQIDLYGIEVPTEPLARRWHYIQTVAIVTQAELTEVFTKITELSASGIRKAEEVHAVVDSFPDTAPDSRRQVDPPGAVDAR